MGGQRGDLTYKQSKYSSRETPITSDQPLSYLSIFLLQKLVCAGNLIIVGFGISLQLAGTQNQIILESGYTLRRNIKKNTISDETSIYS